MNNGHDLYPALLTLPDGRILLARNKRALDARGRDVFSIVVHLWGTDGRFAANPVTVYRDTAAIGELFVRINHPRSMIRLSNRTVLLTYDTGPWGGPTSRRRSPSGWPDPGRRPPLIIGSTRGGLTPDWPGQPMAPLTAAGGDAMADWSQT